MKIGIVVEPYEEESESGIALCIREEILGLPKLLARNDFTLYSRRAIKKEWLAKNAANVIVSGSLLGKILWFWRRYFFDRTSLPDVLLFNMPLLPLVLPKCIKTIPVFYELIYETPGIKSLERRLSILIERLFAPIAVTRASHVITPSAGSYSDISREYKIPAHKISRVYLGYQPVPEVDEGEVSKDLLSLNGRSFFLFVGKVKYKKNLHGMIEAFIRFRQDKARKDKFVIVGDYGGEYYASLVSLLTKTGLKQDVLFVGYRSGQDRAFLYRRANALFFCTLQEGFGMPVIEAMSIGVPVLTSDIAPMNEIACGAAVLADPLSVSAMAGSLEKLCSNEDNRTRLVEDGKKVAQKYSWGTHNQEISRIINEL